MRTTFNLVGTPTRRVADSGEFWIEVYRDDRGNGSSPRVAAPVYHHLAIDLTSGALLGRQFADAGQREVGPRAPTARPGGRRALAERSQAGRGDLAILDEHADVDAAVQLLAAAPGSRGARQPDGCGPVTPSRYRHPDSTSWCAASA